MDDNKCNDKPLKIIEFRVENTKRIEAIEIYPEDKNVIVLTGKNRQGKSTVLDAIWMALGGKSHIPDVPIKTGEKEAEIHIDLGEFSVTRKITESGDTLKVKGNNGKTITSPQKFLDSCLSDMSGNPLDFMNMKPVKQLEMVQKMFPVKVDQSKIEEIAGAASKVFKLSDDHILYLSNVRKFLFEERTGVNSEIKRLTGAIESFDIPNGFKSAKPVPQDELFRKLEQLQEDDRANGAKKLELNRLSSSVKNLEVDILRKEKEINDTIAEIDRIQKKLNGLNMDRFKLNENLDTEKRRLVDKKNEVDNIVHINFDEINSRLAVNQTLISREQSKKDLKSSEKESKQLTEQIEKLDVYKIEVTKQAKLPLPALGFSGAGLTYNGLPLDQASSREQIEISCAICLAQHSKIGVITIDRGWSDLDEDGKSVISNFAKKTGAQIWVTKVQETPGLDGFHIFDGRLYAVDGVLLEEDVAVEEAGE